MSDKATLLEKAVQLADDIKKVHGSYKKEAKGRLKKRERLIQWGTKMQDLWDLYKQNHNELIQLEDEEGGTSMQGSYEATKLYYDDLCANVQLKLGQPFNKVIEGQSNDVNIEEKKEEEEQNNDESDENTDYEHDQNDNFATPKPLPKSLYSRFVLRDNEMKTKIEETVNRFNSKAKLFNKHLDVIEESIKNNMHSRAKMSIKNISSKWNDLSEYMDELSFVMGDDAVDYEEIFNATWSRYDQLSEEANNERQEKTTHLKLKPIEIPYFNGATKMWPTYSGLFKTMVMENNALTECEKMQYLKTTVKGEAASLIANLGIMDKKLDSAWKILTERFEDKRAIRESQLELLLQIPDMRFESSNELMKYYDKGKECVELLNEISAEQILLYLLMKKIPAETRKTYEQSRENPKEEQKLAEYFEFIYKRCKVLQAVELNIKGSIKKVKDKCMQCNENHALFMCDKFKSLSVHERRETVKQKSLCWLCLKGTPKHTALECKFKKMCPQCDKRHNGLLHVNEGEKNNSGEKKFDKFGTRSKEQNKKAYVATTESSSVICATTHDENNINTLLATALVRIKMMCGWSETIRVLIDQGSMTSFISEKIVKQLRLSITPNKINVCGIAGSIEAAKGTVAIELGARYPTSFSTKVTAIVLKKLTTMLPNNDFDKSFIYTDQLVMADPEFNKSDKIDMILGADVYSKIIMNGIMKPMDKSFVIQETELGWIISGPINKQRKEFNEALCMMCTTNEMDEKLQKFWELEEISEEEILTPDEQSCVDYFNNTIRRDIDGAYIASLPFRGDPATMLGDSRRMAMARLFQMEKKFEKDEILKEAYIAYMNELIERGYMIRCGYDINKPHCYLPHHPVMKDSTTTKVRPVFDASRKTSNGVSLNDLLRPGPKLQEDLFNILIRFRTHAVAFTADIEKMYLHVKLDANDQVFQKVLWRDSKEKPIEDYQLTTIAFGINISPYIAVATVQHHARSEVEKFPEACSIILKDSYMDDVSSGCDTVEEAIKIRKEITQVLKGAGFPLKKWASNCDEFLDSIPSEEIELKTKTIGGHKFVAMLGLKWFYECDRLGFKMDIERNAEKLTKRAILSQITTIYDPLGLMSPITIYNKILMQDIWRTNCEWDDEVSEDIAIKWNALKKELPLIEKIKPRRWLECTKGNKIELHGFSDASEAAMGACVYMKVYKDNEIHVNLVAAKTKVAPIKKITLPRLELSAAVLLTRLMNTVKKALKLEISETHFYSDSEIVLAWINGDIGRWKTFVANRVSKILEHSENHQWHYIYTKTNPADFASRGLLPNQLINNTLWWHGPSVLLNEENCKDNIYNMQPYDTELEKKKPKVKTFHSNIDLDCISRFSTLEHTVRVIAYCKRFMNKLKEKRKIVTALSKAETLRTVKKQVLEPEELEAAKTHLIKLYQEKFFDKEIKNNHEKQPLPKNSRLLSLNPFLDDKGVLRVGGRLQKSEFSFNKKHPIIIPYGSHLMKMIIRNAHLKTMHGGNQLTLCQIRHEYWITSAKRAVKAYINNCVTCRRLTRQNAWQLMGNLPAARTKIVEKAFTYTGTDLCGPIHLRMMAKRGVKTQKGYIVIFICLSTRAIHIEIVVDLTAESFIAAFRRFIGRRGNVLHLYCDNGTNFVGANTILKLESEEAMNDYNMQIKDSLSSMNTKFHFNPSISPWMGGIWERGVGSIKHHLKRTVGDRVLTYEELSTVLTQIEAILNSRPISPLSENAEDLDILTPGHFLVGSALTAPIEPDLLNENVNRLSKWQVCSRMKQEFWNKWSNDYISSLQIRSKWKKEQENLKVGDMVLLKEDNTPPLQWPLGRVVKVYPGEDGLVRVVEVAAKNKTYKRPIVKLAKLPIENEIKDKAQVYLENSGAAVSQCNKSQQEYNEEKKTSETLTKENAANRKTRAKRKKQKKTASVAESQPKADIPQRKQSRNVILCAFIAALACFSFLPTTNANEFEIIPFNKSACVQFYRCSDISVVNGNWNLITYMDLSGYEKDLKTIEINYNNVKQQCSKKNSTECTQMAEEIEHKIAEIRTIDVLIRKKLSTITKRSAAFWYSLLGSAVAMMGEKILHAFTDSDKSTEEVMSEQISVLEVVNDEMRVQQARSEEQYATMYTYLTTVEFYNKQRDIFDALTYKTARLNPSWITPYDLQNEIDKIKNILPNNTRLISDEALDIYKLATVETLMTLSAIVSVIKIPLVDNSELHCMKATPMPFLHENKHVIPIIEYEGIWYNNKSVYLSNGNEECKQHNNNKFCKVNGPLWIREKTDVCIFNLFINKTDSKCLYAETNQEKWKKISTNQWMYNFEAAEKIEIKCNEMNFDIFLNGAGMLKFNENCQITTNTHKFSTEKELNTNMKEEMHAQLHQVAGSVTVHSNVNKKIETMNLLTNHHLHHYIGIYAIILMLLLGSIYIYNALLATEP